MPCQPLSTPIQMKAALELLRCVSMQPAPPHGRGHADVYRRTAFILGAENLHTSLRRADEKIAKMRKACND
eukprot:1420199-Pleurochrysis_carterae.AAC.1